MWILAIKKIITKLQSIDPESLHIEEGTKSYIWISLGGRNRIDLMGGPGKSGDLNWRIRWGEGVEIVLRE